MNTVNKAMAALGYVTAAFIIGLVVVVLSVASKQGMEAGTLLDTCETKYERSCELVAIPEEIE